MSAGPQPSLALRAYAELELRLDGLEGDSYQVELRFTDSGSDAEINPERGGAPISLDELLELRLSPKPYGEKLADQVFHEENVRGLWRQAKASAESKGFFLRLRLTVGPSAPELHGLRWELLRDPDSGAALATSERVLLSRFMSSQDLRDVQLVPKTDLKALIAVAAPSNLDEYRLADVDPDGEVERVKRALAGIDTAVVGQDKDDPLTLDRLTNRLRQGVDILYLVCHGFLKRGGEPYLFLQDKEGEAERVSGADFAQRLSELEKPPSLVVLASCESAGTEEAAVSADDKPAAQASLAPLLAKAGVPAVVAMQGKISMETIERAMPVFFSQLAIDGQIDRAMAVARGTVRERPDSWMPALFLRLKSGRIWHEPGIAEEDLDHVSSGSVLSLAAHYKEKWDETKDATALAAATKLYRRVWRRTRDYRAGFPLAKIAIETREWKEFATVAPWALWAHPALKASLAILVAAWVVTANTPDVYRVKVTVLDPKGEAVSQKDSVDFVVKEGDREIDHTPTTGEGSARELEIAAADVNSQMSISATIGYAYLQGQSEAIDPEWFKTDYEIAIRLQKDTSARVTGKVVGIVDGRTERLEGVLISVERHEDEAVETGPQGEFSLPAYAAVGQEVYVNVNKSGFESFNGLCMTGESVTITLEAGRIRPCRTDP